MAYVKNTWVDQEGQVRYKETQDGDFKILTPNYEQVTEIGTPVNADNMNHIEQGIAGCAIRKHNLTETFNLGEWVLGGTDDDEGIYKSLVSNNVGNALTDNTKWEKVELGGGATRNIGEIVASTIPLTDAGLHLLDGSLIQGSGIYSAFVDYIADLFEEYPPTVVTKYFRDTQIILPTFTANTQDGITISDSRSNTTVLQTILNGSSEYQLIGAWNTYWLNINYGRNTLLDSYTIQADNSGSPEYPSAWTLQGSNNGTDWDILDTQSGVTFSLNQSKTFSVNTQQVYQQYRLVFSAGVESAGAGQLKQITFDAYSVISKQYYEDSFFATEAQWQTAVTTYGVCGKFVYDSVNNTVRLPKYSNKIYTGGGTAPVVGNGKTLGLTDGTLNAGIQPTSGGLLSPNVNQYGNDVGQTATASFITNLKGLGVTTDAEKSGIIAQLSDITTSLDGYYYIVVATSTKTDIQVDIDEIATDLNGKADIDLSNTVPAQSFINSVKSWISFAPDYANATSISFTNGGAVGFDGWLAAEISCSAPEQEAYAAINGIKFARTRSGDRSAAGYLGAGVIMVSSTDIVSWNLYASFRKIPFKGGN